VQPHPPPNEVARGGGVLESAGPLLSRTVTIGSLALALWGCRRLATQADCQLIVDKSVELQLKELSETDAAAISHREQEVRAELESEIKSCENGRVTEKTMNCVRSARATSDLDKCLR
jgi:hypothetical protein